MKPARFVSLFYLFFSLCWAYAQTPQSSAKPAAPTATPTNKTPDKVKPYGGKTIRVMVNAGHGGKDPGRPRGSQTMMHEKDVNLKIALRLGQYIEERIEGVEVVYSRKTDATQSLDNIVEKANNGKVDYFISIHSNSNPNRAIYGTRTHIHSHKFAASRKLAIMIEKEFGTRAGRLSHGIQDARDRGYNLQVLQYTEMPGVLVECGFLTNPTEEKFLNSEYGQDIIASAIFRAFRDFVVEKHGMEDRSTVYKVQILASTKQVDLEDARFKNLGMRVEELEYPQETFRYRYMVGREYDKSLASKLAQKVRDKGFKDAFVVPLDERAKKK